MTTTIAAIITIITSNITTLAAISAPLLTLKLKNKHVMQMKELEIFYLKKCDTFNLFFKYYATYISLKYDHKALMESIGECLLISSGKTAQSLQELLNIFSSEKSKNIETCKPYFDKCVTLMREELVSSQQ